MGEGEAPMEEAEVPMDEKRVPTENTEVPTAGWTRRRGIMWQVERQLNCAKDARTKASWLTSGYMTGLADGGGLHSSWLPPPPPPPLRMGHTSACQTDRGAAKRVKTKFTLFFYRAWPGSGET